MHGHHFMPQQQTYGWNVPLLFRQIPAFCTLPFQLNGWLLMELIFCVNTLTYYLDATRLYLWYLTDQWRIQDGAFGANAPPLSTLWRSQPCF